MKSALRIKIEYGMLTGFSTIGTKVVSGCRRVGTDLNRVLLVMGASVRVYNLIRDVETDGLSRH